MCKHHSYNLGDDTLPHQLRVDSSGAKPYAASDERCRGMNGNKQRLGKIVPFQVAMLQTPTHSPEPWGEP